MNRSAPAGLAKFDSAAAMVLALSRFLHGKDFPALGQSRWLQYPVSAANLIPRGARERLFAFMGGSEGVCPARAGTVSAASIADWMVGLYPQRRYPAIMIGSSNGALVHIGAALGTPWLPQTFLVLIKQTGVHPDDAVRALEAAREPASRFLAANPDVQLHHMHDPSQDRLMLDYITYFRPKLLWLPDGYRDFITRCLEPGGAIILIECERRWPTTRVDARYVFQFGALGGPT